MASQNRPGYKVLTPLDYAAKPAVQELLRQGVELQPAKRQERHAEPGDVVFDLPDFSIPWLLEQGHIEPVGEVKHDS